MEDESMKEKALVILSGGLDSTTLLYDVVKQGYETYAISFDYQQKHRKELLFARKTCMKLGVNHKVVKLDVLNELAPSALTRKKMKVPEGHYEDESMKLTVVPNRNMIMISLATAYAISIKATHLFYGAHSGDHSIYPDCRPEFVKAMHEALKLCDWNEVLLHAPYLNLDKGDIVMEGVKLGVDYELTWTCYKGGKFACGKCGACRERLEAFRKAKVIDPLLYRRIEK